MGKSKRTCPRSSKRYLNIIAVPYPISKEENDERLKRLSSDIWNCILSSKRRTAFTEDEVGQLLDEKLEETLGLEESGSIQTGGVRKVVTKR